MKKEPQKMSTLTIDTHNVICLVTGKY